MFLPYKVFPLSSNYSTFCRRKISLQIHTILGLFVFRKMLEESHTFFHESISLQNQGFFYKKRGIIDTYHFVLVVYADSIFEKCLDYFEVTLRCSSL